MAKDALDVACELLAGEDGACPALLYDWKHPEGCLWLYDTTKPGMGTCTRHRRRCWRIWCEQQAEASDVGD